MYSQTSISFHPILLDPWQRQRGEEVSERRNQCLEVGEGNADGPEENRRDEVREDQDDKTARPALLPGLLRLHAGIAMEDGFDDGVMITHALE